MNNYDIVLMGARHNQLGAAAYLASYQPNSLDRKGPARWEDI